MKTQASETSEDKSIRISRSDLPLSCPMPGQPGWSSHPKVFLPIEDSKDGSCSCPYCGQRYQLDTI